MYASVNKAIIGSNNGRYVYLSAEGWQYPLAYWFISIRKTPIFTYSFTNVYIFFSQLHLHIQQNIFPLICSSRVLLGHL